MVYCTVKAHPQPPHSIHRSSRQRPAISQVTSRGSAPSSQQCVCEQPVLLLHSDVAAAVQLVRVGKREIPSEIMSEIMTGITSEIQSNERNMSEIMRATYSQIPTDVS